MQQKHRKVLSYGHFLTPIVNNSSSSDETSSVIPLSPKQPLTSYDPYYLDDDTTLEPNDLLSSQVLPNQGAGKNY